jgi:hypothetical protein
VPNAEAREKFFKISKWEELIFVKFIAFIWLKEAKKPSKQHKG